MKFDFRARLFLISLLGTFVITRAYLHLSPNTDFNVGAYNIHHLFTGLILITASAIPLVLQAVKGWWEKVALIAFGIGLSLALDEWVYLLTTDGSNASYLLPISLWGGIVMIGLGVVYTIVVIFLRNRSR